MKWRPIETFPKAEQEHSSASVACLVKGGKISYSTNPENYEEYTVVVAYWWLSGFYVDHSDLCTVINPTHWMSIEDLLACEEETDLARSKLT
jgi:hypothetical protein